MTAQTAAGLASISITAFTRVAAPSGVETGKISTNGSSGTVPDLPLATFVDTTCLTISLPATRCLPFLKQLYPDCRTPSLWRILKNADLPQANRLDRPFPSCFDVN